MGSAAPLASRRQTCSKALYTAEEAFEFQSEGRAARALQAGTSLRALVFPAKTARRHSCEFLSAGATQADNDNVGQSSLPYPRERGLARVPNGKGKKEAVTRARVALRAYSVPARRTRA